MAMSITLLLIQGNASLINNKANYFGIFHLNIASLNNHSDGLSNVLIIIKFNFPSIGLRK